MCVDLVGDDFVGGAWPGRVVMGEWFALLYNGGETGEILSLLKDYFKLGLKDSDGVS